MLEPLRFNPEKAPPFAIDKPVFCESCLASKKKRDNPGIASRYCIECIGKRFLCADCEWEAHRFGKPQKHVRQLIVIGHGIRKTITTRGDAVNFPLPLDFVEIRYKARVYNNGKLVHREPQAIMKYQAGLSGKSVHVQVLGARNILAADFGGSSDPYVAAVYSGRRVGFTRVRPKALNPKWDNESFIVPMDPHLPDPRNASRALKGMFRLECYDYDWWGAHDLLGQVEIPRIKLYKMAMAAKCQPICLPLTTREFHGICGIKMGYCDRFFHFAVMRAECLDQADLMGMSDPYAKAYLGEYFIGQTPVEDDTLDPEWTEENVFKIHLNDFLKFEKKLLKLKRKRELKKLAENVNDPLLSDAFGINRNDEEKDLEANAIENEGDDDPHKDELVIFRIDIYDYNAIRDHVHLGSARVHVEMIRKLLPFLPQYPIEMPEPMTDLQKKAIGPVLDMTIPPGTEKKTYYDKFMELFQKKKVVEESDDDDDNDIMVYDLDEANKKSFGEDSDPLLDQLISRIIIEDPDDLTEKESQSITRDKYIKRKPQPVEETKFEQKDASEKKGWGLFSSKKVQPIEEKQIEPFSPGNENIDDYDDGENNSTIATNSPQGSGEVFSPQSGTGSNKSSPTGNADSMPTTPKSLRQKAMVKAGINAEKIRRGMMDSLHESTEEDNSKNEELVLEDTDNNNDNGNTSNEPNDEAPSIQKNDDNINSNHHAQKKVRHGDEGMNSEEIDKLQRLGIESMVGDHFGDANEYPDDNPDSSFKISTNKNNNDEDYGDNTNDEDPVEEDDDDNDNEEESSKSPKEKLVENPSSSSVLSPWALLEKAKEQRDKFNKVEEQEAIREAMNEKIVWSNIRHFDVEKDSQAVDTHITDRGFLVVRLIPAQRGNVIQGLDEGVRMMTIGEVATLKVRYDHAYGNFSLGNTVPARSNIVFTIELLTVNGYGRLGVFWRMFKRVIRRIYIILYTIYKYIYIFIRHIHRKKFIRTYISSVFNKFRKVKEDDGDSQVDSAFDEESSMAESSTKVADDEDSSNIFQSKYATIKPAKHMKKLITPSVITGSQYFWEFRPENRPTFKKPPKIQEWEKEEYSGIDHLFEKINEDDEQNNDNEDDYTKSKGASKRKTKRESKMEKPVITPTNSKKK